MQHAIMSYQTIIDGISIKFLKKLSFGLVLLREKSSNQTNYYLAPKHFLAIHSRASTRDLSRAKQEG